MEHLESLIRMSGAFPFFAYLDPGTGSLILQVVIGFLVGALLTLKMFWGRISTWVKNLSSSGGELAGEQEEPEE